MAWAPSWLVTWLQGISVFDLIIWALGIVAIFLFIRTKGWRWVIAFARAILATAQVIDSVKELPDFIAEQRAATAKMRTQLENSHITNLRDDVTEAIDTAKRVEEGVLGLHGRMDIVEKQVTQLAVTDDELRAEIENTQPGGTR